MEDSKITVALLDDHPMILEGLNNILSQVNDIHVAGAHLTPADLLLHLDNIKTDVLLLDIQMPECNGDTLIDGIRRISPSTKILVCTNIDAPVYVNSLLRAGVEGYVVKTCNPAALIQAIRSVAQGGYVLDESLKEKLEDFRYRNVKSTYLKNNLTERESEILQYIVDGYSNKAISEVLFLGLRTVEFYRTNLLLKMDVANTAALVKKALYSGMAK